MKKILLIMTTLAFLGCTSLEQQKAKEHNLIRGMNYSKSGNYTKAIEEYNKFYEVDKKDPILLREMGLAYAKLNDFKTAEKYYLSAIKVEPKDQVTLTNLAILYYKMENYKESKKYINLLSSDSINSRVMLLEGSIAYREQDYEKAYGILSRILNLMKVEDYSFAEKYVDILQKTSRTNEIYPFIYKVYQAQSQNANSVITYSRFLIDVFGDYTGALKALKKYIATEKNDKVILEIAKLSFKINQVKESELYLSLLTNAYRYDLEVLNLKKDLAIKKDDLNKASEYTKMIERIRGI